MTYIPEDPGTWIPDMLNGRFKETYMAPEAVLDDTRKNYNIEGKTKIYAYINFMSEEGYNYFVNKLKAKNGRLSIGEIAV